MEGRFKAADAGSYDALAADFDRLSEAHTGRIADALAALPNRLNLDRVLDVGCGSGLLTRRLRAGNVVGLDLSSGMLSDAKKRSTADFLRADAECLGLRDAAVDGVASLFALLHLPDPEACLHECRRILRPGGCIFLGYGSGPHWTSPQAVVRIGQELGARWRSGFRAPLRAPQFLDAIVEEATGPREGEVTALARGDAQTSVETLFQQAGLRITARDWVGDCRVLTSPEEFWEVQAVFSSFSRKRLAAASEQQRASIRAQFFERCDAASRKGVEMVYAFGASIVSAVKV